MRNVAAGRITRRHMIRAAGAAALGGTLLRSPVCAEVALKTLSPVDTFDPAGRYVVKAIALAPDGKSMLTASHDSGATVWDLATKTPVKKLPTEDIQDAKFVGDGKRALTVSGKKVLIWTIADARVVRTITPGGADFVVVAVAPDGRSMVVAQDRTLTLWDLGNGARIQARAAPDEGDIFRPILSPDGKRLACTHIGFVRVYDMPSLAPVADWRLGNYDYVGGTAFSPDGGRIFVGEKEQVTVFDIASKEPVARIAGPAEALFLGMAVLHDGDTFVAGDHWRAGRCWVGSLARRAFIAQSDPLQVDGLAISPDQRRAYVFSGSTIHAFDIAGVS